MNEAPTNGDSSSLKDVYDDYLIRYDTALRNGDALPALPVELANTSFAHQAQSGVQLLRLLARARDAVMGPEGLPRLNAAPLERVGPFRLVRELGRGGHGVVYLAVDERLGRQVALKLSRPETLLDPDLRKRFLREAQAAGQLDHPRLVPLHEAGEEGRLVYIASQYVDGKDLAQWLAEQTAPVPPRQAAELVAALAEGVEHAHAHSILHRDIKPSNVLLSEEGGRHSPRLTDFGLAKLLEASHDQTQTPIGVLLGTPTYMAPELATGKLRDLGPATDVYGLGAVLYETIVGRPPFCGENDADTIHQVVHAEPLDPRRLRPGLSPELAAICLKCLEKQPELRYESAALLATDLKRYLNGQPTLARPATYAVQVWKWARKRPAVTGLSLALGATLCVLVMGGVWVGSRLSKALNDQRFANQQLTDTNTSLKQAIDSLSIADKASKGRALAAITTSAQAHLWNSDAVRARAVIDRALAKGAEPFNDFASRWLGRIVAAEDYQTLANGPLHAVVLSHDGKNFATGGEDGIVRLWRADDGSLLHELSTANTRALPIYGLAFSPNDELVISGGGDAQKGEVILWDVPGRRRQKHLEGFSSQVNGVAFSSDGRWVAAAGSAVLVASKEHSAEVRIWELNAIANGTARVWQSPAWDCAYGLAFSHDSAKLAVGYGKAQQGALGLREIANGVETVLPAKAKLSTVVFTADGHRMVAGDSLGGITAWSYPEQAELGRDVVRKDSHVVAVAPAAAGRQVFVASCYRQADQTLYDVTRWEAHSSPELTAALGNGLGECSALAAMRDGVCLLIAGPDGRARRWKIDSHTLWSRLISIPFFNEMALSPEDTHVGVIGEEGIWIQHLSKGTRTQLTSPNKLPTMAFGGSHSEVYTGGDDGIVRRYTIDGERLNPEVVTQHGSHPMRDASGNQNSRVRSLDFAAATRCLVSGGNDGRIQLWDASSRSLVFETEDLGDRVRDVRFSRDGTLIAAAVANGVARIWKAANGELIGEWIHSEETWSVAFSPDGFQLAVGGDLGTIWLHDLRSGNEEPLELLGKGPINSLDYSPDGSTLAAISDFDNVVLWEPRAGARLLELTGFRGRMLKTRFAQHGGFLAADMGNLVIMWSIVGTQPLSPLPKRAQFEIAPQVANQSLSPAAYVSRFRQAALLAERDDGDTAAIRLKDLAVDLEPAVDLPFELGYLLRQASGHTRPARGSGDIATSLALSDDGRLAAIGTVSGKTTLLRLPSEGNPSFTAGTAIRALAMTRRPYRLFAATALGVKIGEVDRMEWSNELADTVDVFAIAVSPDGRWLAVGGRDRLHDEARVCRIDLSNESREVASVLIRPAAPRDDATVSVESLAFAPDGKTLAVGYGTGADGEVAFWNLEPGREISIRWTGFDAPVASLAYSPDGATLAAGALDGTLSFWNVVSQSPIVQLPSEGGPIQRAAFSRDGRFVATGSAFSGGPGRPSQLLLWDVSQRSLVASLARFPVGIVGLESLPSGGELLALTEDRALRAFPYLDREMYRRMPAHQGAILAMQFDRAGRLLTSGQDGMIHAWDLDDRALVASLEQPADAVREMTFAANDATFLTRDRSSEVVLRDAALGGSLRKVAPTGHAIIGLARAKDGTFVVSDVEGHLVQCDSLGEPVKRWRSSWGPAQHLHIYDSVRRAVIATCADKVVAWDLSSGKEMQVLDVGDKVLSLTLSPDGKLIAAGTSLGAIHLWHAHSGRLLATTSEYVDGITAIEFARDTRTLATAAGDGRVTLWQVPSLERLMSLDAPRVSVTDLRFSPRGDRLIASQADGALVIWRAK